MKKHKARGTNWKYDYTLHPKHSSRHQMLLNVRIFSSSCEMYQNLCVSSSWCVKILHLSRENIIVAAAQADFHDPDKWPRKVHFSSSS